MKDLRNQHMHERLIQLLEAISSASNPVSVQDLITMTGFPRTSIYRNISALTETGLVEEAEPGNRYVLGMRFVKIALTGKSDSHVINAITPMMQTTVRSLVETAFVARYRGGRVEVIHIVTPNDPAVSYIYPGLGQRPFHACASGKAITAFVDPSLAEAMKDANPTRYNERTIVNRDEFQREMDRVRRDGYAICDGEMELGVISIAVPVMIDKLGSIFALGIIGPESRIKNVIQDRILPVLRRESVRAAAAIQHCSVIEAESTNTEGLTAARRKPQSVS
jgi:DNA-binding IclR family transcriptional regulator